MIVQGVQQTLAAFARKTLQVNKAAPVATRSGAQVVIAAMRARAPKQTGAMAGSIRELGTETDAEGTSTAVGATVDYDRFVQKGTRYMDAQPYGEEAAEMVEAAVATQMGAVMKIAVER